MYGSWTQDYYLTDPPQGVASGRMNYAVLSIQKELNYNGYSPGVLDGVFGELTGTSVRKFQVVHGLKADSIVGPVTARQLCQTRIHAAASSKSVPFTIVGGIVRVESAYDFGAQGFIDHHDRGLGQINSTAHPEIPDSSAFDSTFTIAWIVDYVRTALRKFKDSECAIASYNIGMAGANYWCIDKDSNPMVQQYVANVLKGA